MPLICRRGRYTLLIPSGFSVVMRCVVLIRCPQCSFDREIDAARIPPNAVVATCPRCGTRFRFRNADGTPTPVETSSQREPVGEAPASAASPASSRYSTLEPGSEDHTRSMRENRVRSSGGTIIPISDEHPEDDPLPPGAMTISSPGDPAEQDNNGVGDRRAALSTRGEPVSAESGSSPDRTDTAPQRDEWTHEARSDAVSSVLRRVAGRADAKERGAASENGASPERMDIPWERPERYNPLAALYQTIIRVMFSAPRFFTGVAGARGRLWRPLAFYLLLGIFQTFMERMWFHMSIEAHAPSITDPQMQEVLGSLARSMSLPMTLLLSPVLLALQLLVFTGIFFLMVRLVQPERAEFAALFRVVAYSAAPTVLCVVPIVGPLVGTLWFAVSCLIGTRYALDLPWSRVLLALGPLYAIAFSVQLQIVRQLLGS